MRRVRTVAAGVVLVGLSACSGGGGDGMSAEDLFAREPENGLGGDRPDVASATTTTMPASASAIDRPDVEPVPCGGLLDIWEADIALGLLDLEMSERNAFAYSRGETCQWVWTEDESVTAIIGPGLPSDTEPGARLLDVTGTPVEGVGEAAAWFTTRDQGLLAVGASTSLGQLNFRIILGRPAVGPEEREVAIEVAHIILPRFPGVERPPPPEIDLVGRRAPLDRSRDGLVELLDAGVADGRWDEGEGLLSLLTAAVGEAPPPSGWSELDGFASSATGLVAVARAHVDRGGDPEVVEELERLLDELFPSRQRLARAELVPPTTSTTTSTTPTTTTTTTTTTTPGTSSSTTPNGFRRVPAIAAPCTDPLIGDTCIDTINIPELDAAYGDDKYLVFVGATNEPPSYIGWSLDEIAVIIDGIRTSAQRFEDLGEMPTVTVMLAAGGEAPTASDVDPDLCTIVVSPDVRTYTGVNQQQQFVAGQMAHCFLAATFTEQYTGRYDPNAWWSAGAAIWLSNLVYPDANVEWIHLPESLTFHELQTSIVERSQTNGMWFQHLRWEYGIDGVLDEVGLMPASPGAGALAGWPEMARVFHDYVHSLSDLGVPDAGQDQLAGFYDVPADLIEVDAPTTTLIDLDAFRMNRLHLVVLNGDVACIDAAPSGGARLTWRSGGPGETGNWSEDLPASLEGDAMFAGSSLADGGSMRVTVTDVVDDPDDCEPDDGPDADAADDTGCQLDCGSSEFYSTPDNEGS